MNTTPPVRQALGHSSAMSLVQTGRGGAFHEGHAMATATQDVQYKTLSRFPGYRFGDDGTVWSHRLGNEWRKLNPAKMYAPVRCGRRKLTSLRIRLWGVSLLAHRVILEAFVGPCPSGMECCHLDGDPENNRLGNLRWGTPKDNAADSISHGTMTTKLTASQVVDIREKYITGKFLEIELAAAYGVSAHAINEILQGKSWKHIPIRSAMAKTIRKIAKHNQGRRGRSMKRT